MRTKGPRTLVRKPVGLFHLPGGISFNVPSSRKQVTACSHDHAAFVGTGYAFGLPSSPRGGSGLRSMPYSSRTTLDPSFLATRFGPDRQREVLKYDRDTLAASTG